MEPAAETRRALAYLRDLVEDSDIPHSEIERRLAFSRGYLSRLLTGSIDLKLWQLVGILDAIGETPAKFFSELFPRRPPSQLPTRRKPRTAAGLTVTRDVVLVYGFGIDAIRDLGRRLERCEKALAELHRSGVLDRLTPSPSPQSARERGRR
ncbi:MAG: hypothetical protein GY856_04245 [bacterium]|nr:hypothetical protein [bacterium]